MRQLMVALAYLLLSGCFGAQVRQTAPSAPSAPAPSAPSPLATPASMAGTASMLVMSSYAQWQEANKAIRAQGKDPLAHNGLVVLLPVRLWDGRGWNKAATAAFFHWAPGARLSPAQRRAVAAADVVVACYATTLPIQAKAKAWVASVGKTQAWGVTTGPGWVLVHGQDEGTTKAPSAQDDEALARDAAEGMSK